MKISFFCIILLLTAFSVALMRKVEWHYAEKLIKIDAYICKTSLNQSRELTISVTFPAG